MILFVFCLENNPNCGLQSSTQLSKQQFTCPEEQIQKYFKNFWIYKSLTFFGLLAEILRPFANNFRLCRRKCIQSVYMNFNEMCTFF